jgi:hypothetical protein
MPVINNPLQLGKAVDFSGSINIIPNQWGLMQRLGLFTPFNGTQKSIMIARNTETDHLMVDRNWDERNPTIGRGSRDTITLPIPHYPVDDAILPNDIDGVIDFDSILAGGAQLETIEKKRVEKMNRIRRAHSTLLEMARLQLVKNGSVYAPNGTVNINFYTEYGITRQSINMNLASTTVRPQVGIEQAIAYLQDGLQTGDIVTQFVAICSPEFFAALTSNAFVQEQYVYFARGGEQNGLTIGRLTAGAPLDGRYRTFDYGGVLWIEVRGQVAGVRYVTANEAYMFPLGTENFETHFAPANRLSTVNKTALDSYYFEYINQKDDIIEIMSETNFLNVLRRPDQVVTLTIGA